MDKQLSLFYRPDGDVLGELVDQLPELPSVIRYYDDFADTLRSIRNPSEAESFEIYLAGRCVSLPFDQSSKHLATLMKQVFLHLLGEGLSPGTAFFYVHSGRSIEAENVVKLLDAGPTGISSFWASFLSSDLPKHAYACAKSLLKLLSKYRLRGWSESYLDAITALPLPFHDKYAVVRSGEAFVSVNDEAAIVRFLDEASNDCDTLSGVALQRAGTLLCAYQFGMRPIQIAMLKWRDVRIRNEPNSSYSIVHLTFRMVKQRSESATKNLLRRVKSEWTPIFVALKRHANERGEESTDSVFGVQSANDVTRRITKLLSAVLEGDATAFNLRHTAAQRLVDAGASQEELAEFLGHSDVTTALVYYETSANQAERVNRALGISEIYQRVARIAHDRFIGAEELAQLKESQQIGGAPHGMPIAGIGGCTSGQAACPYNPILSCYGCRKFMPIHDLQMHSKVLTDFRGVARFFHDSSRGDAVSPAYLQLERTIAEIQAVVVELEGSPP